MSDWREKQLEQEEEDGTEGQPFDNIIGSSSTLSLSRSQLRLIKLPTVFAFVACLCSLFFTKVFAQMCLAAFLPRSVVTLSGPACAGPYPYVYLHLSWATHLRLAERKTIYGYLAHKQADLWVLTG